MIKVKSACVKAEEGISLVSHGNSKSSVRLAKIRYVIVDTVHLIRL